MASGNWVFLGVGNLSCILSLTRIGHFLVQNWSQWESEFTFYKLYQVNKDLISRRNCCCWDRPCGTSVSGREGSTGFGLKSSAQSISLDLIDIMYFICFPCLNNGFVNSHSLNTDQLNFKFYWGFPEIRGRLSNVQRWLKTQLQIRNLFWKILTWRSPVKIANELMTQTRWSTFL